MNTLAVVHSFSLRQAKSQAIGLCRREEERASQISYGQDGLHDAVYVVRIRANQCVTNLVSYNVSEDEVGVDNMPFGECADSRIKNIDQAGILVLSTGHSESKRIALDNSLGQVCWYDS